MRFVRSLSIAAVVLLGFVLFLSAYTVNQTEQVIITQFGRPVGKPITSPGLHLKLPFIQQVIRFDQRYLAWMGRWLKCRLRTRPMCKWRPSRVGASRIQCSTTSASGMSEAHSPDSRIFWA
ncbi:MAG: hypothetical protein LC647_06235, partial [Beggiatoa sp.]|nr:hypothetical protein [Beggiatoa sp.]